MYDLNIKVLTIPQHLYRNYMLIGHLETMGFKVQHRLRKGRLWFYNGFHYQDYETNADLIRAVIADGWTQWEEVLEQADCESLDLLSAENSEKRALMPPADEKSQKSGNWLLRLVGARERLAYFSYI